MRKKTLKELERKIPLSIYKNPEELGESLAEYILTEIIAVKNQAQKFLLGCPGGRSLRSTYMALGEKARLFQADLSQLIIVMMDEYLVKTHKGFEYCPDNAHYSCRRFAREEILGVINKCIPDKSLQIQEKNVWFPDPENPADYDVRLSQASGINIFLIASGASDGHVAFNPPGSSLNTGTRIITLAKTTRGDNFHTFPDFRNLSEVPKYGVSVGLKTMVELSQFVILVIHGVHKKKAVHCLAEYDDFSPDWPASLIYRCNKARLLLDEAAAF